MELEKVKLEFEEVEINQLIEKLNKLHNNQQQDFAELCYTVDKIRSWFVDNPDCLVKAKYGADYYNGKELFKMLGFTNKQVNRYCSCYQKFMILDDVGSKLKEPFVSFSPSKLFELLPLCVDKLVEFINSGQLSADMTVKEIREFLKSFDVVDETTEEVQEESILLEEENYVVLKNDTARKDFLDNYKTWGLWFEEPRLRLKYYRCKIGDIVLVAVLGYYKSYSGGDYENHHFLKLNDAGSLSVGYEMSFNDIFSKMKAVPDKRVYLFN